MIEATTGKVIASIEETGPSMFDIVYEDGSTCLMAGNYIELVPSPINGF